MSDLRGTAAAQLAAFTTGLSFEALPADVLEAAKCKLLDAYGCGLAAVALGECSAVLRWAARTGGDGDALVTGSGLRAAEAALATGTLIHALDFDDTHPESLCHVTAVVGTAAVVAGQAVGATGAQVLVAQVAGSEAVARLGAVASGDWHERGIHPTAACGVFGATLAAGKLMGLDAETLASALGLAGSTSSGLFEYLADGSQTKPFHAGWAAHAGILAAELAAAGLRGPATVVEGRFGLFGALLAQDRAADVHAQLADLGERWETTRIAIKPYPTCHFTHAAIEAAAALAAAGVQSADVTAIRSPCRRRPCRSCSTHARPRSRRAALTTRSSPSPTPSRRRSSTATWTCRPSVPSTLGSRRSCVWPRPRSTSLSGAGRTRRSSLGQN
jgi:2-methylcitrate dehydratase PrpD